MVARDSIIEPGFMQTLRPAVDTSDHIQGEPGAAVQLVEYGDYASAACWPLVPIIHQLRRYFGLDLCFVFRGFPRRDRHPLAETAAETAEFAAAHQRFWEMHELLFSNQGRLDRPGLLGHAAALGLSLVELEAAWNGHVFSTRVRRDIKSGILSGVVDAPTFFVNGRMFTGDADFDSLAIALEEALADS